MPDFTVPPWSDWLPAIRNPGGPILLIIVLAILAVRGARPFVHGVVKTVFDRNGWPGRTTVDGKFEWLGESGKCCVSRHKPNRWLYTRPDLPTADPSRKFPE